MIHMGVNWAAIQNATASATTSTTPAIMATTSPRPDRATPIHTARSESARSIVAVGSSLVVACCVGCTNHPTKPAPTPSTSPVRTAGSTLGASSHESRPLCMATLQVIETAAKVAIPSDIAARNRKDHPRAPLHKSWQRGDPQRGSESKAHEQRQQRVSPARAGGIGARTAPVDRDGAGSVAQPARAARRPRQASASRGCRAPRARTS